MNFVKERNLIVAYDGETKMGAWNITTGEFIGKKGKPVKSIPSCFNFDNLAGNAFDNNKNINLSYVIRQFRDWNNSWNTYTIERGMRLECLISVGLFPNNFDALDSTIPLTKDVVKYCKEETLNYYSTWHVESYYVEKRYASYLENKPEWFQRSFKNLCLQDLPIDYIKTMLNRMMLEHVDSFYGESSCAISTLIKDYFNKSTELYEKVEVPHNILTQYGILKYLYEENKKAHYDEILKANNDKSWLYYENDDYIVRPLLTRKAFHEEAEAQDNCVERLYMEKVYNGKTNVVTIRHKSDPNESYITCEVDKLGEIVQYLLRFNQRPTNDKDRNFRKEYQLYLLDNISEEE